MRLGRLRAWLVCALVLGVVGTGGGAANAQAPELDAPKEGHFYVRVYFDDLALAHAIAASFEPVESDYEKGYLLLEVSHEEHEKLLKAGLVAEIDHEAEERYRRLFEAGVPISSIAGYTCYRTVEETFATAQSLLATYPSFVTWTDIGNSWEKSIGRTGYDLFVLKLTNAAVPGPKPKLLINSGLHAREYTPVELALRFAESLLTGYGVDADATWLLDHHELHLLLQSNPDGRKKAEAGASWRKNVNEGYCGATSSSRGADLNRNFAFQWGCCNGSSTSPCNETYRGPSAASEPETQALQAYMATIFPDQRGPAMTDAAPATATGIFLDLHSSGRLLLWPWGMVSTVAPNGTALQTLGRKLAYFNNHSPGQSVGLYPTDGATDDHAYGTLGVAAYTFELGTAFFETCSYFTNTLLPANLPALRYAFKVARTPYQTPAGPEALSLALSAGGTSPGVAAGTPVTLTATLNDARYNNTNGTEPSQAIAAAEAYLDVPPWGAGAAPLAMSAADGAFNTSTEGVRLVVDTTGLGLGRHTLFVRGRDAAGNWGAVSAAFLFIGEGGGGGVGPATAVYDAVLKVPRCSAPSTSCDSGTLLVGRGTRGPEPNRPNTINAACADGNSGTFHVDESNDRIRVATVDGSALAAGKTVRIEATVWAFSTFTSDRLDLYYAANANSPSWTFLATLSPTAGGAQTLSTTYTLPAGALQAVRARFRYQGSAAACATGSYIDHDDLVFAVQ